MLYSEFSIEKLFPKKGESLSEIQFKTLPFSKLIDIKKSKTTCFDKGLNQPGIYVFWWVGTKKELEGLNRKILLKGKVDKLSKEHNGKLGHHCHEIDFSADWFPKNSDRYALYVGKSTNIAKRFSLHLKMGTSHEKWNESWDQRIESKKADPNQCVLKNGYYSVYSPTTSCQFRSGIELLFKTKELTESEFWKNIQENIEFSYLTFENTDTNGPIKDSSVAERFYLEDYLIGALRPWFNIDSER
jgi:hypothetical protein